MNPFTGATSAPTRPSDRLAKIKARVEMGGCLSYPEVEFLLGMIDEMATFIGAKEAA